VSADPERPGAGDEAGHSDGKCDRARFGTRRPAVIIQTSFMERQMISAGWLRLRPFVTSDVSWVHEVSQDPVLQHFVQVPSPYRLEHAAFFVEHIAIACWDSGQRAEFVAEDAATGTQLGRVGLHVREPGVAEVGYWVDRRSRQRGVATAAVQAACQWAFTTLDVELIEWRCEVGNTASRRVAEKAGFLIEATLRKRLVHRGTRVNAWVGSLLPDEVPALVSG
jgi:RimJ/RimL family protein N-acetyltransferase